MDENRKMKLRHRVILIGLAAGFTYILFGIKEGMVPLVLEIGKTLYEVFDEAKKFIVKI